VSKIIKIGLLFLNLYEWMFFLKHGVVVETFISVAFVFCSIYILFYFNILLYVF